MATLKKLTRVGSDVRQIARLLQAKAPEGHMLAYITPEEAELLKSRGGSGKEHADTGIPSYEYDAEQYYSQDEAGTPVSLSPASAVAGTPLPSMDYTPNVTAPSYPSGFDAPVPYSSIGEPVQSAGQSRVTPGQLTGPSGVTLYGSASQFPSYSGESTFPTAYSSFPEYTPPSLPPAMTGESVPTTFDTTPEKGIMERLSEATGMKPETLSRLGLAGGLAALGSYQGGKARKQAEEAKREQQKLAEPYQAKGAELQRQAQAGELTPVGQQQLQAVQAQAAQQAAGRGGAVSAAQTQAQIEAFRNQLLQQQYDYGLKLSGIGDNIALGAIKTGLEADRYVQQLSNNFYTNMANIVGGLPAQTPQQYRSA